jgi:PAS domain S-box-containing protein
MEIFADKFKTDDIYKQLINSSNDLVQAIDANGKFIFVNNKWLEVLKYKKSDIKNLNVFDIIKPEFVDHCKVLFNQIKKGKTLENIEVCFVSKNNKDVFLNGNISLVKNKKDKFFTTVGFFRDITEKKQIEEKIKLKQTFQEAVLNISSSFVSYADFDKTINKSLKMIGKLFHASRAYLFQMSDDLKRFSNTHEWCNIGVNPEIKNLQDMPIGDFKWWVNKHKKRLGVLLHSLNDIPNNVKGLKKVLDDQGIKSLISMPIFHGDQLRGFIGFDNNYDENSFNQVHADILSILANILENAFEQEEYKNLLLKTEKRFKETADLHPGIICEMDIKGNLVYINKVGIRTLKVSRRDIKNGVNMRNFLDKAYHKKLEGKVKDLFNNEYKGPNEYVLFDKNNKKINVLINSIPIANNKEVTGIRSSIIDITDIKKVELDLAKKNLELNEKSQNLKETNKLLIRAEKELQLLNKELENKVKDRTKALRDSYEELKRLDKIKDEFVSNISHELRTPLTSIRAYNQLMFDEILGKITPKQKDSLKIILGNTDHLIHLINNLLRINKLSSGKTELHIQSFSLVDLINKVLTDFNPRIDGIKGVVKTDFLKKSNIKADYEKIEQVLTNLISNAIKYKSSKKFVLVVSLKLENKNYLISIKDNGIGIPKKDQSKIFDKFYQVDQGMTKKVQGDGLGLAIVKDIVDLQKGRIEVKSSKGLGTEFLVSIPVKYE